MSCGICQRKSLYATIVAVLFVTVTASASYGQDPKKAADERICNSESMETLVAAAQREGTVTLYESPSGLDKVIPPAFKEKYGITVDALRLAEAALVQRFSAEADAGANAADVFIGPDNGFVEDAVSRGWMLGDLAKAGIPDFPGEFPSDLLKGPKARIFENALGIAYNTKKVKVPPQEWPDVLDPAYKGEVLIPSVKSSETYIAFWDALATRYGEDFLNKFASQKPLVFDSGIPAVQALAAGEGLIAVGVSFVHVKALAAKGAPVGIWIPKVTFSNRYVLALSSNPPHPNAACLLTHWMMQRDGQTAMTKSSGGPSVAYDPDKLPKEELPSPWSASPTTERKDQILSTIGG